MATTPEGKIKRKLDAMLKSKGVWFFSPQAGPFGRSGIPDRIACVDGHFVGVEAKACKGNQPTDLQRQCMEKISDAGGTCFVVYDDQTIENLSAWIDQRRDVDARN